MLHPIHSSDNVNPTLGLKFCDLILFFFFRKDVQSRCSTEAGRSSSSQTGQSNGTNSSFLRLSVLSHSDFIKQSRLCHLEIPTTRRGVTLLWSQHEETWVCYYSLFIRTISLSFSSPECMLHWIFYGKKREQSDRIKSSLSGFCVVRSGPFSFR